MRIEFERSGGFMGLRQVLHLDTASLEPNEAAQLSNLVDQANFFTLPDRQEPQVHSADQYQYRLTVERSDASHTVYLSDTTAPPSVQPLLQHLNLLARKRR